MTNPAHTTRRVTSELKSIFSMATLTPDQQKIFDSQMRYWQGVLNLKDWRIEKGGKAAKDAMAQVVFDDPARMANYSVGDFGHTPINDETISQTALHECLHIFLHDLLLTATDRGSSSDDIEAEEHRVINTLEKILYGR